MDGGQVEFSSGALVPELPLSLCCILLSTNHSLVAATFLMYQHDEEMQLKLRKRMLKKKNSTDRAAGRLSQAEARRWQTVAEVGQELHCPGCLADLWQVNKASDFVVLAGAHSGDEALYGSVGSLSSTQPEAQGCHQWCKGQAVLC